MDLRLADSVTIAIGILIVDDDAACIRRLRFALEAVGYTVSAESHAAEGWDRFLASDPDVLVVDVLVDGHSAAPLAAAGLELIRDVRRIRPDSAVLVLSRDCSEMLRVAAFHAGADDYLCVPTSVPKMVERIDALVRRGYRGRADQQRMTGQLEGLGRSSPRAIDATAGADLGLTAREAQVAELLANRMTTVEIAEELDISWHTARRHCEHVLSKLDVHSRLDVRRVLAGFDDRMT